jgi:hypothetical protein
MNQLEWGPQLVYSPTNVLFQARINLASVHFLRFRSERAGVLVHTEIYKIKMNLFVSA